MYAKLGSEVNDAFTMDGDKITTTTNNSGGIQGGYYQWFTTRYASGHQANTIHL